MMDGELKFIMLELSEVKVGYYMLVFCIKDCDGNL